MRSTEQHIDRDKEREGVLEKKALNYAKQIARIITACDYLKPESALAIAGDSDYQDEIQKSIAGLKDAEHIVLVGIGGSSLGTEAVFNALAFATSPRLLVLDAIEEASFQALEDLIANTDSAGSLAVIVVSKSGTTAETMANGVRALKACEEKFGNEIHERTVFIGTSGTEFMEIGKKKKVICLTLPESISGRYSICTAVGMAPLALLGIDTVSFREGAVEAVLPRSKKQIIKHAARLAVLAERGVHTVNFFTFNERLEYLGYWYRQLLAESIGKTMTTDGATFSHQLLPTVATSVDLHSMAQLYLGGYRGMYTHFVYADVESEYHTLSDHWLLRHMEMLEGHTPQAIKNAIREGVLQAYDDQKLPYRLTSFEKLTAYELGFLMASLMFEIMILGRIFDVNVFDQPNVESYKLHTREILAR